MHRKLNSVLPEKRAAILATELHTLSVADLLYYFPRKYVDRTRQTSVWEEGHALSAIVTVESVYFIYQRRSQLILRTRSEGGQSIECIWFHAPRYMQKMFSNNSKLFIFGKLQKSKSTYRIFHPDFEIIKNENDKQSSEMDRIVPFYSITSGLKKHQVDNRSLRRIMYQILQTTQVPEILPDLLQKKYHLLSRKIALQNIHFPQQPADLKNAKVRLKFEELFALNCHILRQGRMGKSVTRQVFPVSFDTCKLQQEMLQRLPFSLTQDQKKSIESFFTILQQNPASRILLQGDVGCGKTLTALSIGLHYVEANYQIAIMAPTEVLAKQHFLTIAGLMGIEFGHRIDLLTGSLKTKKRSLTLDRIRNGQSQIIIGTHSLLSNDVKFHNLGLAIIDEQHRFGVEQRKTILTKGAGTDLLAMSATPIPRSLCLTAFSDLDLIVIREKPKNRGKIKTLLLTEERRQGVYNSIRNYVGKKQQCFIVYPIISESEKLDIQAAQKSYEEIRKNIFPEFSVGLLHGRMKSKDKDKVMERVKTGKIDILVSTNVIEVGVDCPNVTIMLIESCERFGLSQLHQLRGRVGRGEKDSHCVLLTQKHHLENPETQKRLEAFCKTTDGFALAELDLQFRGAGEILGTRQHGFDGLLLANLVTDRELVAVTHQEARRFMQQEQEQEQEPEMKAEMKAGKEGSNSEERATSAETVSRYKMFWEFVDNRFQEKQINSH